MWDITVGGSAIQGENKGFDDIYLVEQDILLEELKLQYEEVQDAKWASREEIMRLVEEEKFIPYHQHLIHLLFDMRKQYGCHK